MTKQWLDRLWFSSLAVLGGILFLLMAAHADVAAMDISGAIGH
jgi:hypothetical protein